MSMGTKILAGVALPLAMCAALTAGPVAAREHSKMRHAHRMHASRHMAYRSLTVGVQPAAPAYYNPFSGPAPFITGPVAIAGSIVALPFRALSALFPYQGGIGQNPLVIVGAPLHYAGQVAQVPFYIVGRTFGGNPTFPN